MSEPLLIEIRCNEGAGREQNKQVPFGVEDVVADAIEVARAGAAILHWHPREVTGAASTDPDVFQAVVDGVRENTDLLLHPTLGYIDTQDDPRRRVTQAIRPELPRHRRVDIVPVDFGTFNADLWDAESARFLSTDSVYRNSTQALLTMIKSLREHDVFVNCVCWSTGHIRTARAFQQMGLLSQRVLWTFAFGGDRLPGVMGPTLPDLLACIEAIPDGEPWTVYCYHGDAMPLAAWAATLGGNVSLGIGDYPYARFGYPSNADLVRKVASIAETIGRRVASAGEARRILRIDAPTGVGTLTDGGART